MTQNVPALKADELHLAGYAMLDGQRRPAFVIMPSAEGIAEITRRHGDVVIRVFYKAELQGALARYERIHGSDTAPDAWSPTPAPFVDGLCVSVPVCEWYDSKNFTLVEQAGAAKALLSLFDYEKVVVLCRRSSL